MRPEFPMCGIWERQLSAPIAAVPVHLTLTSNLSFESGFCSNAMLKSSFISCNPAAWASLKPDCAQQQETCGGHKRCGGHCDHPGCDDRDEVGATDEFATGAFARFRLSGFPSFPPIRRRGSALWPCPNTWPTLAGLCPARENHGRTMYLSSDKCSGFPNNISRYSLYWLTDPQWKRMDRAWCRTSARRTRHG